MNSVCKEFKQIVPKLSANLALALAFILTGFFSSLISASVNENFSYYSWLVLTLVGGAFLVRTISNIITVSDLAAGLLLVRLGLQRRSSKRRIAKDLIWIIVIILITTAIFPILETLSSLGYILQSFTAIVSSGIIFLFVYDITREILQIIHEKISTIANWFAKGEKKTK